MKLSDKIDLSSLKAPHHESVTNTASAANGAATGGSVPITDWQIVDILPPLSQEIGTSVAAAGEIEQLKQKEALLLHLLEQTQIEKRNILRSKKLNIGIIGFGRFGRFMAKTFCKHANVIATSRSDYTDIANEMGVKYVPLSKMKEFLKERLDVIVLATSIVSFERTVKSLSPHLKEYIEEEKRNGSNKHLGMNSYPCAPLIVDVLSVKEHPRDILLDLLPEECDVLCTHPMFGPDSGKHGWDGLRFVYERTRVNGKILTSNRDSVQVTNNNGVVRSEQGSSESTIESTASRISNSDAGCSLQLQQQQSLKQDENHCQLSQNEMITPEERMERFLSIWEEEGCEMIELTCKDHDSYSANSQFITHLLGRILDEQCLGLGPTPIDTRGFESVLNLVNTTTADSFDLFYGLYKYNRNSMDTIMNLQRSIDHVVGRIKEMEEQDIA